MALFRKMFSSTKHKPKEKGSSQPRTKGTMVTNAAELEAKKQLWQEELQQMSEFLVLKSTEEQKEEGIAQPVDTAYVCEREGLPVLKAVFDVHQFGTDDIQIRTEDGQLVVSAERMEDTDNALYKKTLIRRLDLPDIVDTRLMQFNLSTAGLLAIEMPIHLSPRRKPSGPNVVPIRTDPEGRRRISFSVMIGPDFALDDIRVDHLDNHIEVTASYDAEIGIRGIQVTRRQLVKKFLLPEFVKIDDIEYHLDGAGRLLINIQLKNEQLYKCDIHTEELQPAQASEDIYTD